MLLLNDPPPPPLPLPSSRHEHTAVIPLPGGGYEADKIQGSGVRNHSHTARDFPLTVTNDSPQQGSGSPSCQSTSLPPFRLRASLLIENWCCSAQFTLIQIRPHREDNTQLESVARD